MMSNTGFDANAMIAVMIDTFPGDPEKIKRIARFFRDHPDLLRGNCSMRETRDNLFQERVIAHLDLEDVRTLCGFFTTPHYFIYEALTYASRLVMSKRLGARKKALFAHILLRVRDRTLYTLAERFTHDVFMDNEQARQSRCFHRIDRKTNDFIRHTSSGLGMKTEWYDPADKFPPEIRNFKLDELLSDAIAQDQVAVFEMNRQIQGKNVSSALLLYLLHRRAVQCFTCLLTNYPKEVYRCRTPMEWLFTVCRHIQADVAIPVIEIIESQFPGIVRNARDPWGNTLLWNTLANHHPADALQNRLILLGCDPKSVNQWGLSFQIMQENR